MFCYDGKDTVVPSKNVYVIKICYSQENISIMQVPSSPYVEDVLVCLVLPLVLYIYNYIYTSSNKQNPGLVTGSPL
jgi:hypothetical protein